LTLLRIYLRPTSHTSANLLRPALDLISRHSPRIDTLETLDLLPPLVTAEDVRAFLLEALRAPIMDSRIRRQISKARNDQVSRMLMNLQAKRVKVTDSRMCVQISNFQCIKNTDYPESVLNVEYSFPDVHNVTNV
jgi:Vam6/Vps39-like protein vacuolar protein sorting-associated protein 39